MAKNTEYRLVTSTDHPLELVRAVNDLLKEGWQLSGGISVSSATYKKESLPDSAEGIRTTYAQALIKE